MTSGRDAEFDNGGWPGHNRCYVYDRSGSVIALCGQCEKSWPCVYERAARRQVAGDDLGAASERVAAGPARPRLP